MNTEISSSQQMHSDQWVQWIAIAIAKERVYLRSVVIPTGVTETELNYSEFVPSVPFCGNHNWYMAYNQPH